ncbi:hypothetical protein HYZ78_02985 [Candidatus Microgenomates bacterium]|nr:hypothetical protein [Candidatus Microgenomates bacterium]
MDELTPRQAHILKTLIEEYIDSAEAVGSETLEKKHNLGVSPATIRNEMSQLTKIGYLKQPHASAGRIPTARALRFYIGQLMEERQLPVTEEAKARQTVEDANQNVDHLMREATHSLAEATKSLSVGTVEGEDTVWSAGYSKILDVPEFYNIDVTAHVLSLVEEVKRVRELFFERSVEDPVSILFGEELGWPYWEPVGIITAKFVLGGPDGRVGCIGIIGPARLPYSHVIPIVRYYGGLLADVTKGV